MKRYVAIIKKIEINSKTITKRSIILQFLIKLDVYSIDWTLSGVEVLVCNNRFRDYLIGIRKPFILLNFFRGLSKIFTLSILPIAKNDNCITPDNYKPTIFAGRAEAIIIP